MKESKRSLGSPHDQWLCYNDTLVRKISFDSPWAEIISECLTSGAYPTVIVYEANDEAFSDPPFIFDDIVMQRW